MPCMPLMLVTVLLGLISGHRLDSYLRKPFADVVGGELLRAPGKDFNELGNSREEAAELQRYYGSRKDLLQNLLAVSECGPGGELQSSPRDNVDLESLRANIDNKRDVFNGNYRNMRDNAEVFNDVSDTALDNAPVQVPESAGGLARGDWEAGGAGSSILSALPIAYYADFYEDLMIDSAKEDVKRAGPAPVIGCDCKIKNDLVDLGQQHFPRYLLNAVCQTDQSPNEYPQKCWRGSHCKPLEYKVKVLTFRTVMDHGQKDPALAWLPDDLRQLWKFKTVTVAAGCFCSY